MDDKIKLTQYSHGAGCGCKLSPAVLDEILAGSSKGSPFKDLLVGHEHKDDAAVWEIDHGQVLISTTDFFMPIVDDAYDFGRIAATNAISDVYAMGGKPLMAIAILGWPIGQLPPSVAGEVVRGGRAICEEAGIPLAGGHSIDCPEPIFGLAVTGMAQKQHIKTNSSALSGDLLYLSKPLGVGILSTAQKKGILSAEHAALAIQQMTTLNKIGYELGPLAWVHSITDVTGFGLAGHLIEMCEASGLSAHINYEKIPLIDGLNQYLSQKAIPGGTQRNWTSYGSKLHLQNPDYLNLVCDPQTSGGLLIAIDPDFTTELEELGRAHGLSLKPIGQMSAIQEKTVYIR
jgi:selenide, water dikinase